ncbi:cytochrome C1 [Salinisphaera sp. PC39]|uniref:cytochrome c1 n=1 Tax=Salinisphaera sp. PC39 TaxID=1304156 RepID=UPI00333F83E6
MMRRLVAILLVAAMPAAWGAGGEQVPFEFDPNLGNQASLQRGAKLFLNNCAGCHSLQYLRYNRMAKDLGIPEEILEDKLMLAGGEAHEHIVNSMPKAKAEEWFGKAPPDLSLVARSRGPDWIYSFLLTFYLDDSTATGVNNLVLPNTAMPHVLAPLQGYQHYNADHGEETSGGHGGGGPDFELVREGRLSEAEYRRAVADITNFLTYAGEPAKLVRYGLGVKVIAFLLLFTALAWLLKREYWRDVH